ncbi:MAG: hypothetical protein AAF944_04065 [Bacteroidota bacterium]
MNQRRNVMKHTVRISVLGSMTRVSYGIVDKYNKAEKQTKRFGKIHVEEVSVVAI